MSELFEQDKQTILGLLEEYVHSTDKPRIGQDADGHVYVEFHVDLCRYRITGDSATNLKPLVEKTEKFCRAWFVVWQHRM